MRIRDVLKRLEAEKAGAGEPVDAPPSAANDEAKHAWRTPNAMDAPVKRPGLMLSANPALAAIPFS